MTRFFACMLLGYVWLAGVARGQSVSFGALTTYSLGAGGTVQELLMNDLNADGRPDIVAASGNTIKVLIGTGTGSFSTVSAYSSGMSIYSMALADIDNDGKPDITTVGLTNKMQTVLGNGTGGFASAASYTISGSTLASVAAADLNADGKPDLVAADNIGHYIYVLLNTGGVFGPAVVYPYNSSGTSRIRLVDVNADSFPDVLVSGTGNNSVSVFVNSGNGAFSASNTYPTGGAGPYGIGIADFNNDNRPDVVVSNNSSYGAGVLLNTGNGAFGTSTVYQTSGASQSSARPNDIAVADINGDGRPDLVAVHGTSSSTGTIGVLLGAGNGAFGSAIDIGYGVVGVPTAVAVRDVNNDGKLDLVVGFNGSVGVLLNTTALAARASLPGATASLAPNPTVGITTITLTSLPAAVMQVTATVLDATGRTVWQQQLAANQGTAQAELSAAGLAPGLYLMRLEGYDAQGTLLPLPTQRLQRQ